MKKIFTSLLLTIFCFNLFSFNNTFANDDKSSYIKNMTISKYELNKTNQWQQYIKAIDSFIEKNKNNEELLIKLEERLEKVLENSNLKNKTTLNTLNYLNQKAQIALFDIEENKSLEILTSNISAVDKKTAENKITKLQLNLVESSTNFIENLTKEFEDLNNSEQTWDLKINLDINNENLWEFKSSFELNDYESKTNNFDSQLKWQFKAIVEALPKWDDEIRLQLNSFVDFISKDWNVYLLLKELNITDEKWVEDIKEYLDKLKEIAKQNKYIKYEDNATKMSLELIKSLNPTNISSDLNTVFAKPMFEAYKKEGEKYYIKPTKYACDKMKEYANKFDPFYGKDCSETQYKDMLKDLSKTWNLYLTISWEVTTLWFEWIKDDLIEKNHWYITFNDKEVISFFYEVIANQEEYPNEFFKIDFKNRSSLNIDFYADAWNIDVKLNSKLSTSNKFNFIDLNLKAPDFNWNLDLNNKVITWKFDYTIKWYDNETWEYVDKNYISWTISWKTWTDDKLKEMGIVYTWKDLTKNKQILNWKFSIIGSKFDFENNYSWEYSKSIIVANWEFDNDLQLSDLNLKLDFQNRESTLNYETWEYTYADKFTPTFNVDLVIDDKSVNWTANIYNSWKNVFELKSEWYYTSEKAQINNTFKVNDEYLNSYLGSNLSWNLNFDIDLSNDKNNFYMIFDLISNTWKIVNFEIENNWKTYKWSSEISAPTNTIDYKEVFPTKTYNYDDEYYYDY